MEATSKLEVERNGVVREVLGLEDEMLGFGRGDRHANSAAGEHFLDVPGRWVSRRHGRIVCDGQYFVLIDDSVNGTFVQTEDGKTTFLRRSDIRLWGQGFISLGEPPTKANAIRFFHVD